VALFCCSLMPAFSQVTQKDGKFLPSFVNQQLHGFASQWINYQQQDKNAADFVSIGDDPNCDIQIGDSSIQQVIENGASEIRLTILPGAVPYNEDLFISNRSLNIKGGYLNCDDANNDIQQTTRTRIMGTGSVPVIRISGSNQKYSISLKNLDIRNGVDSDFFLGGGISTLGADANIVLENVNVSNNTGSSGGGLAVNGGDTSVTLIDSIVQYNQANKGGGIYCSGEESSLAIFGQSGVLENTATGQFGEESGGGGMYLADGCIASLFAGSADSSSQYGVSGNISESDGGGIYIKSAGKLNVFGQQFCVLNSCFGDSSEPVNITNNYAKDHHVYDFFGKGGGIFAKGVESEVYLQGVLINNNHAEQKGAGIYTDNVEMNIVRDSSDCWDETRCNFFDGNVTSNQEDDDTYGGAMYNFIGSARIENTYFENNRADYGTALALYFGSTELSSVVINNNGNSGSGGLADQYVISMQDQAQLTLEHVTIADNHAQGALIGRPAISSISVNIYSSILYDVNTGPILDEVAYVSADIHCVIAHDINTLSLLSGTQLSNSNPQFMAPLDRDFHIDAQSSPAVDYCAQSDVLGEVLDMDGTLRGWDDGSVNNHLNNPDNVYDAGADETYDNDIIFQNDFESNL